MTTEGGRTRQLLTGVGVAFLLDIGAGASGAKTDQTVTAAGQRATTPGKRHRTSK